MDRSPEVTAGLCPVGEPEWKPPPWPDGCPQPGIYPDVSYEDYRAWPALNATCLKHGVELSAKHMLQSLQDGSDSQDRRFGRAMHCRLLEGIQAFAERFLVAGPCEATLASGTRKGQPCGVTASVYADGHWYCKTKGHFPEGAETPGDFVTTDQADRMERSVKAIYAHPSVNLIRQHGGVEVSLVWERDGIPCKARLDKLVLDAKCPNTILDLKKCQAYGIAQRQLEKSIVDYYWELQAWWYRDGVERTTGKRCDFLWLFAEDGPPYDVCVLRASKRWLEVGRCRAARAFRQYKWCVATDTWPGVAEDIVPSDPPKWLCRRYAV